MVTVMFGKTTMSSSGTSSSVLTVYSPLWVGASEHIVPSTIEVPLDLEARVFQVEVSGDSVHDQVVDAALAAQLDDGVPLGVQKLATEALVGERLLLERPVVAVVEPRAHPGVAEPVEG